MHYKNGKEAKVGDRVVGHDCCGNVVAGILGSITPGTETCNGNVVPEQIVRMAPLITISDCMLIDDIAVLNENPKQ